jgi:uncharacterized membrane protein YfcA
MTHIDLMHMPSILIFTVLIALFLAGTTKGLLGIGMPIVAVPLLNLIVDLRVTVVLLAIPLIITNIPQAIHGDRIPAVLKRLWSLLAGMVVGVAVGVTLLSMTDPAYLKPVVGIILIAVCVLMWFAPKLTVTPPVERFASPAAGVVGGLAGGLAALPGPFVFVYLLALGLKRDQFVQYSSMFLVISAAVMTLFLHSRGVMDRGDAAISTLATLPIFVGMWAGAFVRQFVSPELFRKLILIVVAISGSQMLLLSIH